MSVRSSLAATTVPWFVVPNDLVGGWAVSHVDKPLSEQGPQAGEGELFDCLTKELADYIVALHHARLAAAQSGQPGRPGHPDGPGHPDRR